MKAMLCALAFTVLAWPGPIATPVAAQNAAASTTRVPDWSEQLAIRERLLIDRHKLILPMMRRHGIAMWIVVNEEFHDDPVIPTIAPPRPHVGNRDYFVFVDDGTDALKAFALTSYPEENLRKFFEPIAGNARAGLTGLYERFKPKTIGLALDGSRGVTRGLTHATYLTLVEWFGVEASAKFTSAAPLISEYFDTRIPGEHEVYTRLVKITDEIARLALSNAVITPGKTTVGDVRRFLYDEYARRGASTWFQPDIRVQRHGANDLEVGKHSATPAAPGPALEGIVIARGDVLHVDMGITAMGFSTDWQKMAYVLKPGETDAPSGLKTAMTNTNALQDAVMVTCSRPGKPNTEAAECAMAEMQRRGIEAQIYSHPIGFQGHGLGAGINSGGGGRGRAGTPLRAGSYISIELSTATPVPEWDGRKIYVMMEDDAYLTDAGWKFFQPRQERWYLIR